MNAYEMTGTDLRYEYTKSDAELPRYIIWLRKSLYIVQIAIMVGAGVCATGAIMAERNGLRFNKHQIPFGRMENELIYIPWACGAISCITAIIGCLGAQFRNKCGRVMLIIYVICLVVSLSLAVGSVAQCFADEANVYNYALRQWRALTATQERVFEWDHLCCNFITIPPCCRFEPSAVRYCINEYVCYEKVEVHLLEQFNLIRGTSMFQAIILGIVLVLSGSLCIFLHCKEIREQKQLENGDKDTNNYTTKKETKPKLMTSYTRNQKRETDANIKRKLTEDDDLQGKYGKNLELTENKNLTLKVIESNEIRNNAIFTPETDGNIQPETKKMVKPKNGKNVKPQNGKNVKPKNGNSGKVGDGKGAKSGNGKNVKVENGKNSKKTKRKTGQNTKRKGSKKKNERIKEKISTNSS